MGKIIVLKMLSLYKAVLENSPGCNLYCEKNLYCEDR